MEKVKEKTSFFRKFVGDKKFYLMVLSIAVPIMIQNGITNFVSLLDNIMIGRIGTEQMSGAAIVNQLILCIISAFSAGYPVQGFLQPSISDRRITRVSVRHFVINSGWQ